MYRGTEAHVAGPGWGFYTWAEGALRMGEVEGKGNCREVVTEMISSSFLSSGLWAPSHPVFHHHETRSLAQPGWSAQYKLT